MLIEGNKVAAYFLYHSIGQYPEKQAGIARVMAEFASVWSAPDDQQWGHVLGQRARFVERWQALIGAEENSVTTCENVTQGVHMLVTSLGPDVLRGKRILVAADCFPSNHFLLARLQERFGFTLDTVAARQGAAWVETEDFLKHWGPDVALALITWVSSTSSHRVDLQALVAHGRAMGSLIGVDITQAVGLLPFSVRSPAIDFAVSTSLKWMCGTPGAGVLYVAPDLTVRCQPELRGWFSQPNPFNWALDRFEYAPDIRRFDNGTPSCMPAIASLPAMDWHAAQDHATILAQNRRHTEWIMAEAQRLGMDVITPRAETRRGGSVMCRMSGGDAAPTVAALRTQGIHADSRGTVLRLSPGVITTDADIETLLAALATQARYS